MPWKRVNHHQLDSTILVNEEGRVYNATTCQEVKQRKKNGYMTVTLRSGGKYKMIGVHRLVCDAFHGAPPTPQHQPDHINGDKTDNRPSNLEWVTPQTNVRRARSKAVRGVSADGVVIELPFLAMASDFGFSVNAISKALHRKKSRESQGFTWQWIDEQPVT